jgi:hypothetical protein
MCRRSARSSGQVGRDSVRLRALGMRTKLTKSMIVALCRSGQHRNERSIVIELNEKSSLRRYLSLSC